MTLMKRAHLLPNLTTWFDDFFGDDLHASRPAQLFKGHATLPAVNIKETNAGFELEIAAPGMRKEDIQIELKDNVLTIASEQKASNEEKDKAGKYVRREFSYTAFKRSFSLPEDTDAQKIEANYKDGILVLSIPKKVVEKTETKRTIEIR